MQVLKTTIHIGLQTPVRFLHITDTHLPKYKPEDPQNVIEREAAEAILRESLQYADDNHLLVLHTGDLLNYCDEGSMKTVDRYFGDRQYIYAVGNHDFCHRGGAAEDAANLERNLHVLAAHFSGDLLFDSHVINGELNVVTLCNCFFQISDQQIELLKAEAAKRLPILLCMHIPIFTPAHADARLQFGGCAHLMAPAEDYLLRYPKKYHIQRPTAATLRAIEYIQDEPAIRAVVAGHTHMNYEEVLKNDTVQIATAGNFEGFVREITVV